MRFVQYAELCKRIVPLQWTWEVGKVSDWSYLAGLKHGWIPQNPNASAQVGADVRLLSSSPVERKGPCTSRLSSSIFKAVFTPTLDKRLSAHVDDIRENM